jgi:hypothetical protein
VSVSPPAPAGTLLDYEITTGPEQLQASPPDGNPSYGSVTIVVTNPSTTTPVLVQQIQFAIPIGADAADLTTAAAAGGILVTASPSAQWQIAPTAAGVFTATPLPGFGTVTGTGLAFRLSNIVLNQQVGTAMLTVQETSAAAPAGTTPTPVPSTAMFPLPKFPYGFFVSHLTASAPQVPDGGTVTLTWVGSDGPTYAIRYGGASVDVTGVRTWTSPALSQDTTFILQASGQSGGETVTESLSVTVTVADPSLTVHDLTVQTTATVEGALSVAGTSTVGPVTAASANVQGNLTAASAYLQGNLTALGAVQVGPPSAFGTLGVLTANATNPSNQAISASNASPTAACGFFRNPTAPLQSGLVSGVGVQVAAGAIGLWTNGLIASAGSSAAVTVLPTAAGSRVVTSPLSLEPEIHLSGTAQLSSGTATVALDPDAAGIVFHGDDAPFRVLLTPTAACNGLAVTRKDAGSFVVQELAAGRSDATFDWFLVAHRRADAGSPDRAVLPAQLPAPPSAG